MKSLNATPLASSALPPCRIAAVCSAQKRSRRRSSNTLGEQTAIADSFARAADFLDAVANTRYREIETRAAASAVYNASSAAFLAWEDSQLRLVGNKTTGDRLAIAQNVLRHKLSARDPYAQDADEADLAARLLSEDNATLVAAQ